MGVITSIRWVEVAHMWWLLVYEALVLEVVALSHHLFLHLWSHTRVALVIVPIKLFIIAVW